MIVQQQADVYRPVNNPELIISRSFQQLVLALCQRQRAALRLDDGGHAPS
jgi:hypothetical protein